MIQKVGLMLIMHFSDDEIRYQHLIDFYDSLIQGKYKLQGKIKNIINLIEHIAINDIVNCEKQYRIDWMEILLDIYSITTICREDINPSIIRDEPRAENPDYLAPPKERRAKLLKTSNHQYGDWNFSNRIRAWHRYVHRSLPIRDLDDLRSRNDKSIDVCDYLFRIGPVNCFIECKNSNVAPFQAYEGLLDQMGRKINKAREQLDLTVKSMN